MAGKVLIGVSGWRYTPWRGHFYPRGLAQWRELEHASRAFPTLELNGSFYSLQRPSSYLTWCEQTPPGFVFAIKGSRYITHAAAQLAQKRDSRLEGREWLQPGRNRRLRHAVEVRHDSFVTPDFIRLLRKYRIAWVVADTPKPWPLYEDVTSDFVYMRLHGSTELYQSRYSTGELERWAELIAAWRQGLQVADARLIAPTGFRPRTGRDVFCYFDNTDKRHAPDNARELMQLLNP